jgi:hypothetical protein
MLIAAALALAQLGQSAVPAHDPEIEALLRRRDEQRRAEALSQPVPAPGDDREGLAAVVPPAVAERLAACLAIANAKPSEGLAEAQRWARAESGGAHAALCHGYALGRAERWAEAPAVFESGAAMPGLDAAMRARLFAQAGNAALIAGDAARSARLFDAALAGPLPRTLATGEIHLDRARARVAAGDLAGARADLDIAVTLAGGDPLAWLLSATLARRMDDLPLARLHIEEAAKRARNDAAVALEQGIIHALSGDNDAAARAAFSRARELAGTDSAIARQAADYLAQLGAAPQPAHAPAPDPDRQAGR